MRYQFFYRDFLLESRFKRLEDRDLKAFLKKYVGIPNAMFSFRDKLKSSAYPSGINPSIGINPRNVHNTPTGIYGYPLEETFYTMMTDSLPYATNRPIVVVYKPKTNVPVIRTSTFSKNDLEEKIEILKKLFSLSSEQIEFEIDKIESRYKKNYAQTLWSLVRALTKQNVNKWSKTMISLNIPILIDDNNSGTIHQNESTQCVVFGNNFVDIIGVYERPNKSSKLSSTSKVGDIILDSLWDFLDGQLLNKKRMFFADRKIMHLLKYINEFNSEERFELTNYLLRQFDTFLFKNGLKEESVILLLEKYISFIIPKTFDTSSDFKEVLYLFNALFSKSGSQFFKRIVKIIYVRILESIKEVNSLWNFLVASSFDFNYLNDVDFRDSFYKLIKKNSGKIEEKAVDFSVLLQKYILELSKEINQEPSLIDSKILSLYNFLRFCMNNFSDASFIMTDFVLLAARIFEKYLRNNYNLREIKNTQLYKSLYEVLEYIKYADPKMYKDLQTEEMILKFQERVVEKVIPRIREIEESETTRLLVNLYAKNAPLRSLSELYVSVHLALNDDDSEIRSRIYEEIHDILAERLMNEIPSQKVFEETWYSFTKKSYNSGDMAFFRKLDSFLAKTLDSDKLKKTFSVKKLIDFLTNDWSKVIISDTQEGDVDLKIDKEKFLQLNDELEPERLFIVSNSYYQHIIETKVLPELINIYKEEIQKADLTDIKIL